MSGTAESYMEHNLVMKMDKKYPKPNKIPASQREVHTAIDSTI